MRRDEMYPLQAAGGADSGVEPLEGVTCQFADTNINCSIAAMEPIRLVVRGYQAYICDGCGIVQLRF